MKLPKIAFLHFNHPDYLGASLFHGLRTILGANCVDIPRYDCMYSTLTASMRKKAAGHGFTLYGLLCDLPELSEERFFWHEDLDRYDLYIVSITAHWPLYGASEIAHNLMKQVPSRKLVFLDGHDIPAIFPFSRKVIQHDPIWAFRSLSRHHYFKRELIGEGSTFGLQRFPRGIRRWMTSPKYVHPIAFSIPKEKVTPLQSQQKSKDFPRHIPDPEVAATIQGSFSGGGSGAGSWAFSSERDYYADLQLSRFGITTKRAGWDCLRHYELAANGCVICFRDLQSKPPMCAPHGLDQSNCISYRNVSELHKRIAAISETEYESLLQNTYKWINRNTTTYRAREILSKCGWDIQYERTEISIPTTPLN